MKAEDRIIKTDTVSTISDWHARDAAFAARALDSPENGLSAEEAAVRLKLHGPNELAAAKPRHPLMRLLLQFHNLLLYLMMAAGIITALLGEWVDAGVLWGAV